MSLERKLLVIVSTDDGINSHLCAAGCLLLDKGGLFTSATCRANGHHLAKLPMGDFQRTRFCLEEAK